MNQKNLGFNKENILIIHMQDQLKGKYEAAKNKLLQIPEISSISTSRSPLTSWLMSDMPVWDGNQSDNIFDMGINSVDYDFDETIGIEVIEGRFLTKEYSKDATDGFVINEAAVKAMELKNPVGTKMSIFDGTPYERKGEIIGVIKNMHTQSLHSKIKPFAYMYSPTGSYSWLQKFAYKTELSWWIFALAGIMALLIALITISFQTFKVARRNPVEALRYE